MVFGNTTCPVQASSWCKCCLVQSTVEGGRGLGGAGERERKSESESERERAKNRDKQRETDRETQGQRDRDTGTERFEEGAPASLRRARKEAWPFCRTISGVRLCWELEEPKGPKGTTARSQPDAGSF